MLNSLVSRAVELHGSNKNGFTNVLNTWVWDGKLCTEIHCLNLPRVGNVDRSIVPDGNFHLMLKEGFSS